MQNLVPKGARTAHTLQPGPLMGFELHHKRYDDFLSGPGQQTANQLHDFLDGAVEPRGEICLHCSKTPSRQNPLLANAEPR